MNWKKILIILLAVIIFFIPLFIRNIPSFGIDSYAFINYVYGVSDNLPEYTPPISSFLFSLIPKSYIFIKMIMFTITLISCLIMAKIGELISKKYGWIAGLLLLINTSYSIHFLRFEDDIFGFIPLFISLYFIIKYKFIKDNKKYLIFSILFLFIATLCWKFAIYFLFIYLLLSEFNIIYLLPSIFVIILFFKRLISGILPSLVVAENTPFVGILLLLIFIIGYTKNFRIKKLNIVIIVCTILLFLNLKFIFLIIPFLSLNLVKGVHYLYKTKETKALLLMKITIVLFFIIGVILNLNAIPNKQIDELLDVEQTYNLMHKTNYSKNVIWGYGYYFDFYNKSWTDNYGFYKKTPNKGLVLTFLKDESVKNCKIIKKNKTAKLVLCN